MTRTGCNDSRQCKQSVRITFTLGRVWPKSVQHASFYSSSGGVYHIFMSVMCCWIFRKCTYFIMHIRYPCCPKRCHPDVSVSLFPPIQVCVHSHGSPGPAAHGLPLSEHQPVCGEFSKDGAQAARVRKIQPTDPRNQLCEFPGLYSQFKTAIRCFFYILFFEFCSYEENKLRKPCRF